MSQKYQVELSDGRKFVVESDGGPPSEDDLLSYIDTAHPSGVPRPNDPSMLPGNGKTHAQTTEENIRPGDVRGFGDYAKREGVAAGTEAMAIGRGAMDNLAAANGGSRVDAHEQFFNPEAYRAAHPPQSMGDLAQNVGATVAGAVKAPFAVLGQAYKSVFGPGLTPEEAGKSAVDATAMLGPIAMDPAAAVSAAQSVGRGVKAVATHPAAKVVGNVALDYATAGQHGTRQLIREMMKMQQDAAKAPGIVAAPHVPTAEGYEQFMPNKAAASHAADPNAAALPIRSADAETAAVLDRYMPNQPAASHVVDDPGAGHIPHPESVLDQVDHYMPNQSGVDTVTEPTTSVGAGRTPYGRPDPAAPVNPNAGGQLNTNKVPGVVQQIQQVIDDVRNPGATRVDLAPSHPGGDGMRTVDANRNAIDQMQDRGLSPKPEPKPKAEPKPEPKPKPKTADTTPPDREGAVSARPADAGMLERLYDTLLESQKGPGKYGTYPAGEVGERLMKESKTLLDEAYDTAHSGPAVDSIVDKLTKLLGLKK
jgi:hypothetical protein